eukprot:jgi/Mesvir1/14328/Mv09739-RA.2
MWAKGLGLKGLKEGLGEFAREAIRELDGTRLPVNILSEPRDSVANVSSREGSATGPASVHVDKITDPSTAIMLDHAAVAQPRQGRGYLEHYGYGENAMQDGDGAAQLHTGHIQAPEAPGRVISNVRDPILRGSPQRMSDPDIAVDRDDSFLQTVKPDASISAVTGSMVDDSWGMDVTMGALRDDETGSLGRADDVKWDELELTDADIDMRHLSPRASRPSDDSFGSIRAVDKGVTPAALVAAYPSGQLARPPRKSLEEHPKQGHAGGSLSLGHAGAGMAAHDEHNAGNSDPNAGGEARPAAGRMGAGHEAGMSALGEHGVGTDDRTGGANVTSDAPVVADASMRTHAEGSAALPGNEMSADSESAEGKRMNGAVDVVAARDEPRGVETSKVPARARTKKAARGADTGMPGASPLPDSDSSPKVPGTPPGAGKQAGVARNEAQANGTGSPSGEGDGEATPTSTPIAAASTPRAADTPSGSQPTAIASESASITPSPSPSPGLRGSKSKLGAEKKKGTGKGLKKGTAKQALADAFGQVSTPPPAVPGDAVGGVERGGVDAAAATGSHSAEGTALSVGGAVDVAGVERSGDATQAPVGTDVGKGGASGAKGSANAVPDASDAGSAAAKDDASTPRASEGVGREASGPPPAASIVRGSTAGEELSGDHASAPQAPRSAGKKVRAKEGAAAPLEAGAAAALIRHVEEQDALLAELRASLEAALADRADTEGQLSTLRASMRQLADEHAAESSRWQQQRMQLEATVEALRGDKAALEAVAAAAESKHGQLEGRVKAMAAGLEERLKTLTATIKRTEADNEELRGENKSLAEENKALAEETRGLREALEASNVEQRRMGGVTSAMESTLDRLKEEMRSAEQELAATKRQLAETTAALASAHTEVEQLRPQVLVADERRGFQDAIAAGAVEVAALKEELTQLNLQLLASAADAKKRAKQAKDAEMRALAAEEVARELKASLAVLEEAQVATNAELGRMKAEAERRARSFNTAVKAAVEKMKQEWEAEREQLQLQVASLKELEGELREQEAGAAALAVEYEDAARAARAARDAALQTLAETVAERDTLRERGAEAERAAAERAEEAASRDKELRAAEDKIQQLVAATELAQAQLKAARHEAQQAAERWRAQVQELSSQLAHAEQSRDAATVLALQAQSHTSVSGDELAGAHQAASDLRLRLAEAEQRAEEQRKRADKAEAAAQEAQQRAQAAAAASAPRAHVLEGMGLDGVREERLTWHEQLRSGNAESVGLAIASATKRGLKELLPKGAQRGTGSDASFGVLGRWHQPQQGLLGVLADWLGYLWSGAESLQRGLMANTELASLTSSSSSSASGGVGAMLRGRISSRSALLLVYLVLLHVMVMLSFNKRSSSTLDNCGGMGGDMRLLLPSPLQGQTIVGS